MADAGIDGSDTTIIATGVRTTMTDLLPDLVTGVESDCGSEELAGCADLA
jgi:hypothetical protein